MVVRALRKCLLIWLTAWMCMAGVIAAAMPVNALATVATPDSGYPVSTPCHTPDGLPNELPTLPSDGVCGHCLLCHLATAMSVAVMASPALGEAPRWERVFARGEPPSFDPEPDSPPPRV
jgi:hypothetical protein